MTSSVTYYNVELIKSVKMFIVQASALKEALKERRKKIQIKALSGF